LSIAHGFLRMAVFGAGIFFAASQPADSLPIFAHVYGVPCQKCHTAIPTLNALGKAFLDNGYHIPGAGAPAPVFPLAVKVNLLYTSAPDPGLPKAVVDEIEILTAGTVGPRGNYFVEQYAVDGGRHGNLREAWFNERLTPPGAGVPIDLRAGQFTLPVPVDPESFRETYNDYAVFVQTVGRNPFNFFDPKPGVSAHFGRYDRGLNFEFSALEGRDEQSGLPTAGTDLMQTIHELLGPFDLSAYRYAGRRTLAPDFAASTGTPDADRFTRTSVGLRFAAGRWTSESVLQQNTDTNAEGLGTALHSSGGFTQLRYAITAKLFGLVRYDGTNDDNGFLRSTTALLGYRLSHNSRVTFEDVVAHDPNTTHTLNTQFTIAY
jgi:hypothetical protein